jgi:outer membrane receptor for ferrienterochelin and colicins
MGGVVNIITRKPAKEWMGALTLENTQQQHREFGNSAAISFYTSGALIEDKLGLTLRGSVFDRSASDLRYQDANGLERTPIRGANPVKSDIQNNPDLYTIWFKIIFDQFYHFLEEHTL